MNSATKTLKLLHLTDLHLYADINRKKAGVSTYQTLCQVLEQVQTRTDWPVDAILVTGDIVQDESQEGYELFLELMTPLKIPVFCLPGNHDNPIYMQQILPNKNVHYCETAKIYGWNLIFLDSTIPEQNSGRIGKDLSLLEKELSAHLDQPTLICLHHHILPIGSRWLDEIGIEDSSEFLKSIDRFDNVRAVLSGHVHQESENTYGEIKFLTSPSTCYQFVPGSDCYKVSAELPGYRWLELHSDGRIDGYVEWVSPYSSQQSEQLMAMDVKIHKNSVSNQAFQNDCNPPGVNLLWIADSSS